ncbi:hypothetical protein ACWT_2707 [Actinoplanes sp. SE50]|uniref:DUF72 domain-containing protein n=1 Tax=unclassified Actinoplanes TaxID=2626549 RepID=UPI00023ECAEE|nr:MULTISPECIES: DUF72 domain-containing protein [unclassified Actinoplanes]AEV83734.1 yecE-like uncharacterized protein [Actinoplanes sp. SE50/110]ATO82122.1 hypothetical protein ACWT_2707 [Actinoplanes sp. SE50]SLL99529.1 hypothetical protein ACSP50_2760 [Actinoplanes sp. SE50/110]
MWSLKAWQARFATGDRLRAYAGWCNAVEGNTTFYATPARATVATWAEQTAPDFRLIPKVPKRITHELRMSGAEEDLRVFLDAMEPLGPRATALWIQLPGSFGPGDLAVLSRFLRSLPMDRRYAVEVRHPDFFTDPGRLTELLAAHDAEWVPFDTTTFFASPPTSAAERDAWLKKPRMPRRDTALTDHPIVRYLGRDDTERTVAGWQPWVATTAGWLREGRSPTVFLHTPDNADAPDLARRFHAEVAALVPGLPPLPEPAPREAEGPATLF